MNKEEITRNLKNYITKTNIKFCKVNGSHVFDLCMEVDKLQQEKEELINILESVNNEIFQYEARGLLVGTITDSLQNRIKEVLSKLKGE